VAGGWLVDRGEGLEQAAQVLVERASKGRQDRQTGASTGWRIAGSEAGVVKPARQDRQEQTPPPPPPPPPVHSAAVLVAWADVWADVDVGAEDEDVDWVTEGTLKEKTS
jgi:hypothetical protein